MKVAIPQAISIFVLPPSRDVLEQRLRSRSQDSEEVIQRRLRGAAEEVQNYTQYDFVLINRDIEEASARLATIVEAERLRKARMEEEVRPILESFVTEIERREVTIRMAERMRNNAMYAIPDDGEQSTYRFIIVAAKRARQLQNGARPFLPTTSKKPTVTSMEEVRRGLVKYTDSLRVVPRGTRAARITPMNVVLGVGGGIAAYKSAELARALMERGMRVQVVMTDAAREFITPLTFASLTGRKVITGLFSSGESGRNAVERDRAHRRRAGQRNPGDRARHRRSAGALGARTWPTIS